MRVGIEKCAMLVMKSGKQHLTNRMELLNQEKIQHSEKMETCKHLEILKADPIKQEKTKEKMKKVSSAKTESYLRQYYIVETLSKG